MSVETRFSAEAPQISAIIVSYNTREMTLQCLRVLEADLAGIAAEIWVVDNASSDGSADAIRAAFPAVQIIEFRENLGFGAANNAAMERARGAYFLLLNSDAFPRAGAIAALIGALENHPRAGVLGPRLLNRDGTLQRSCWRFPDARQAWLENLGITALLREGSPHADYRRWAHDTAREVDFVIGACLLVRREVWEEIGGFDPDFWMYSEETDWQKRMRAAGYEIWFCPDAVVEHWGGASAGEQKARVNAAFFDSLDLYSLKHGGVRGVLSLRAAMTVGNAIRLPLWLVLWLARPAKRSATSAKIHLAWWLLRRQTTRKLPQIAPRVKKIPSSSLTSGQNPR